MKIKVATFSSLSPPVIPPSFPTEQPLLSAQAVIDASGVGNLIVLLRVRMGFPSETFALAVRPLIGGYAQCVQLRPVPGSRQYNGPGGHVRRALVTTLRALDYRRGQILPRNTPPETLGALAHRWTYAVFVAALLHDLDRDHAEASMRLFESCVPPIIQTWLGEDPALMVELRGVLAGTADLSSVIAELVERAAPSARPTTVASVLPLSQTGSVASTVESSVEPSRNAPEAEEPEFLDSVIAMGSERPRRFMTWVQQGITDGRLPVNARGALVHGVEDGLLLVSPRILRAFIQHDGAGQEQPNDVAKRLQREVLRAGWHLKAEGGVNLHAYVWKQDGHPAERIHGIVILAPQRFFDPMPPLNPALVRVGESASSVK
ncbi:MAG: TraI domain-containing protein [Gammaproteobacteria bacterium]|nr:TraI domain-containing protein [Gammaproteobacteria bacterium]